MMALWPEVARRFTVIKRIVNNDIPQSSTAKSLERDSGKAPSCYHDGMYICHRLQIMYILKSWKSSSQRHFISFLLVTLSSHPPQQSLCHYEVK